MNFFFIENSLKEHWHNQHSLVAVEDGVKQEQSKT